MTVRNRSADLPRGVLSLARIGESGSEIPIAVDTKGETFDLQALTKDIDGHFLSSGGIEAVRHGLATRAFPVVSTSGRRWASPVAQPHAVWCIGMNYGNGAHPTNAHPLTVSLKAPNTVVGPYDDLVLPTGSTMTDVEAELAVVIGRRVNRLDSLEAASAAIAGFTISNDVSERSLQFDQPGGQWTAGKCFPSFNPLGPALVLSLDIASRRPRIYSRINGEICQDALLTDMITSASQIVWRLSQFAVLEAGDVINTGTPPGHGFSRGGPYLRPGDIIELGVNGLGAQIQRCV